MEALEKYGISDSLSNENKMKALQDKQVELLERLDVTDDNKRRMELEKDLSEIEEIISSLFDSKHEEITALKAEKRLEESFDDLKKTEEENKSADNNSKPSPSAINILKSARKYLFGAEKDLPTAMEFLERAYKLDTTNALTLLLLGTCCWGQLKHDDAIRWFKESYKYGSVEAPGSLGLLFQELGYFDDALEWYDRALDLGNEDAPKHKKSLDDLGDIIEISRRAVKGSAIDCYLMGQFFSNRKEDDEFLIREYINNNEFVMKRQKDYGKAIGCNYLSAAFWYKKVIDSSIDKGMPLLADAYFRLGELYNYSFMLGNAADSPNNSVVFYTKAFENGEAFALNCLYNIYKNGLGDIKKDEAKAMEYYIMYAETGNYDACELVGYSYYLGKNSLQVDYEKAEHFYKKGAEQEDKDREKTGSCINGLGLCYLKKGKYDEAIDCFKKGIEKKSPYSAYNLAGLYEELGQMEDAFKWYLVARNDGRKGAISKIEEFQKEGYFTPEDVESISSGNDCSKIESLANAFSTGTFGVEKNEAKADELRKIARGKKMSHTGGLVLSGILGCIGGLVPFLVVYLEYKATNNNLDRLFAEGGLLITIGIELLGLIIIVIAMGLVLLFLPSKFAGYMSIVTRLVSSSFVIVYSIKNTSSLPSGVIFYQIVGTLITLIFVSLIVSISSTVAKS